MSRQSLCISLSVLLTLGLLLANTADAAPPMIKYQAIKPLPSQFQNPGINGGSALNRIPRIDPAVVSLQVRLIRKISPYEAQIAIVGAVKNVGNKDFRSGRNQQSAVLIKNIPGARRPIVLQQRAFTNLNAGASFVVMQTMNWRTSVEFPPSFKLYLSYDPDIRLDSNPLNDDAILTNNMKELDGMKINEIVRRMLR